MVKDNKNIFSVILISFLVLIAFFLRFYNLDKLDLWVDEPYHVYSAKALNETGQPTLPSGTNYSRAPIYTRLVAISFKLLGVNELSVRIPGAIWGVLNVLLVFFIGSYLFNRKVGLIAAFFITFSFFDLAWSRIARFYTLFQFVYLFGVFSFYRGFEHNTGELSNTKSFNFIKQYGFHWGWLIFSCFLFFVAYTIQLITGMFVISMLIYSIIFIVLISIKDNIKTATRSKYFLAFGTIILAFFIGYMFLNLDEMVKWAFSYKPDWADLPKYKNRYYYYNFLTSKYGYPLNAFFLLGVFYSFTRFNKKAFFILLNFVVPLAITSLLFSYKLRNYIFHVYPLYLLIGAYGVSTFYDEELIKIRDFISEKFKNRNACFRWIPGILLVIIMFSWIPLTPWFKLGLKFPWTKVGEFNQIYTHKNWKWAANYVIKQRGKDDTIISSIPLTLQYYNLKSDYNLSKGLNNAAKEQGMIDSQNRYLDPYTGIPTLSTLNEFLDVFSDSSNIWIITDPYASKMESIIDPEILELINKNFQEKISDKNNTVLIYHYTKIF